MKKIFSILLFSILFFSACQENMPEIACLSCDDTTTGPPEPQDRKVLVEEFTGVRCVNCPQGSADIQNLLSIHGNRMIAISLHAGFFAEPYNDNLYDFRTDKGEQILNFVGQPQGYPSAVINRKLFSSEDDLQTSQASWAGFIAEELDRPAEVSVILTPEYNTATRALSIKVEGGAFQAIDEPVHITVQITENDVEDLQITPDGLQADYKHKHVLRRTLTAFDGDVIAQSMAENDTYEVQYSTTLPDNWVANKCSVVVFAHLSGVGDKNILQADEVHLLE